MSAARRDVHTVQILTVGERDFPFRGGHRFRDPETGAEISLRTGRFGPYVQQGDGKGSLFGRMPGDRWQKFANLRAYLSFMWTHPGK